MGHKSWSMTEEERAIFSSMVVEDCASGCLVWVGRRSNYGYGMFHRNHKIGLAHRLAWTTWRGEIPPLPMCIDHLCRNRACQNVDHMEVVDKVTNTMRGQSYFAINARKTECPRGHSLSGENLVIETGPKGNRLRRCRTCRNVYAKTWQAEKRRRMVNTKEDLEWARKNWTTK